MMGDNGERRSSPLMNLGVQVALRVLAIGAAIASIWLMITNSQVASVFGIAFEAKYSYSSAFRYLVYAEIAISAATVFTLVWSCLAVRRGGSLVFALFFFDLLTTMTAISATSAALSEGHIGKHGNKHAGWMPICTYVNGYCTRATISVAMSFASFIFLFILTVISASASRHY